MTDGLARDKVINELLAKQAITEALYRYSRGEDRTDGSLSTSLWHKDGTTTYGHNGELFNGPVTDWPRRIHSALAEYTGSSHQVTNILIELEGEHAVSEAYVTVTLWKMSNDVKVWQRMIVGRYLDRWSFRDGRWAVDHRRFIFDFSYASEPAREEAPEYYEGRHGLTDPSYEVLGNLARRTTR